MELFCPRCNSAQTKFKLIMPTSVMVVNSDDGFKTANLSELRNIADLLTEAVCKVCEGRLDFIPDEYSEYSKAQTIDELDSFDLGMDIGPDPLSSKPEPDSATVVTPQEAPVSKYRLLIGGR